MRSSDGGQTRLPPEPPKYVPCNGPQKHSKEIVMRLFPPPLQIADDEGFTPEKDIFGRADIGRGLTSLLARVNEPLVVAVDGQWGSGKTTFLKMWAGELRKSDIPVVYFDAYEHDYVD